MRTHPKCFDPYLRYAISTDFKTFVPFDKSSKLFFLAEFLPGMHAGKVTKSAFIAEMKRARAAVEFGPAEEETRYVTLRTDRNAVENPGAAKIWDKYFSRLALSLPLSVSQAGALISKMPATLLPSGSVLLGVIDDGCPFAAAQFLGAPTGGGPTTRVLAIWDQDPNRQPVNFPDAGGTTCVFGAVQGTFGYGLEYLRDSAAVGSPRQLGLNEWMRLHLTPTGSIDEDGCYRDAEFKRLAFRILHGSHVMDVLAGRLPTSSRMGPIGPGLDRRDPPNWLPGTDNASAADVVFVQFPESCIDDSTGVWLKAYVVDGIRYILSLADPTKISNVVINLSYGPTTGPHDGTAELEAALVSLVTEYDGVSRKPRLDIALAAGNSYLTDGHIAFKGRHIRPSTVEWVWRLLPDNPVLCFAEIWMTAADAAGVNVTLTSPSGKSYGVPTPTSVASVGGPYAWSTSMMWRLEVGPTIAKAVEVAEHGDWKITVTGIRKGAEMNAYVARTDPNLEAQTNAKRSFFVDPEWEQTKAASANCTYVNGEFSNAGSLIHRHGTLNGIATEQNRNIHVAGGFIVSNERKSRYSSAGPARSGPLPLRVGPDNVLPCDESCALEGIRAGGNRTGIHFRLIGTSAAAPQLARWITRPTLPTAFNAPTTTQGYEERGDGDFPPP
jgi:hypothetical protein